MPLTSRVSVHRLLTLSARQKLAVVRVVGAISAIRLGLLILPGDRLAQLVGTPLVLSDEQPCEAGGWEEISAERRPEMKAFTRILVRRYSRASRQRCLEDSLVIGILLRAFGPRLRLGVVRIEGRLKAHAWIEIQGHSLLADAAFLSLGETRMGALT